jgi:hypothetical protein
MKNSKLHKACQYLYFAQIEDIWLKSALKWERSVLLIRGSYPRITRRNAHALKNCIPLLHPVYLMIK